MLADPVEVRLDADGAELTETVAAVGDEPSALKETVRDERLVGVELEMAPCAAHVDRDVVAEYLRREHDQCLALRRVHLSRHDRAPRLVLRDGDLADPRPR